MDALIVHLGNDYKEDSPMVTELISLSEKADFFYKQKHQEGYVDMEITLEIRVIVTLIVESRRKGLTVSELANEIMDRCVREWTDKSCPEPIE